MRKVDASAKIIRTLDTLEFSKQRHEALIRKYQREIEILTNEALRVNQLAGREPNTDIKPRVLHVLRKRAILRKQVNTLRARVECLFAHELTLEQSVLVTEHINVIKGVRDALNTLQPVESVVSLTDTVQSLTERVCEVSELLSEPTMHTQIDDDDLEDELAKLLEPEVPVAPPEVPVPEFPEVPVAPPEVAVLST